MACLSISSTRSRRARNCGETFTKWAKSAAPPAFICTTQRCITLRITCRSISAFGHVDKVLGFDNLAGCGLDARQRLVGNCLPALQVDNDLRGIPDPVFRQRLPQQSAAPWHVGMRRHPDLITAVGFGPIQGVIDLL